MKTLVLAVALFLVCPAAHAAPFSLGPLVSAPELFGVQAAVFPVPQTSVDFRATLATVDLGVTGHMPVAGDWDGGRHAIVMSALVGYAHNAVSPVRWLSHRGLRLGALAGWGYINGVDLRIQAGITSDPGYGLGFAAQAFCGWLL